MHVVWTLALLKTSISLGPSRPCVTGAVFAFSKVFTPENVNIAFYGAGLLSFNPEKVILKLDIKLSTLSPTESFISAAIP
jgi:hypothetical protein